MPRNSRPGTWFGDITDPDWEGSTRTQRLLAQNQYDIEEQLEKLNNNLEANKVNRDYDEDDYPHVKPDAVLEWEERSREEVYKRTGVDRKVLEMYTNQFNKRVMSEVGKLGKANKRRKEAEEHNEWAQQHKADDSLGLGCLGILLAIGIGIFVGPYNDFSFTATVIVGFLVVYHILKKMYLNKRYAYMDPDIQTSPTCETLIKFLQNNYNKDMCYLLSEGIKQPIKDYYLDLFAALDMEDEVDGYGEPEDYVEFFTKQLRKWDRESKQQR